MSRTVNINKLRDIPVAIAVEIMDNIFVKASDAMVADQEFDAVFPDAKSIVPVHMALKETGAPVSENHNGKDFVYTYGNTQYFNIKQTVDNAMAHVDVSDINAAIDTKFNITDPDELADFLAQGKSVASAALKKLCKVFSARVHEEYSTTYAVAVETIFNKAEFGLVGYFLINDDGSRGRASYINESRLALKMQTDAKVLKKAGDKSDAIAEDYKSVKETQYETSLIAAIQPIVPAIESFGKQMQIFGKSFKEIRTKTGAIRLERTTSASKGTEAVKEKSQISKEEDSE